MELVEVKDLEVGDEILISCQSYFKYLRVLRKPTIGTKKHWKTGNPMYKSVKCSTRRTEKDVTWTGYGGRTITRKEKVFEFGPEDHNFTQYINLGYRQILLIKKANEDI